ncbi:MAG: aldehyde ferredoxin oxidoreductase family protein [Chloroflexi bacterium]|nr:aldehyde ferredoxin oxidoreductase family protein [Chloroflexota bacterium]
MPKGYAGRILHVDLTNGKLEIEQPSEAFYRKYMGGSAMGTYYALRDIPKGADPLGPENALILTLGPVTGLPISGNSRVTATARSPLTDTIGDSQAGGFWPAECKAAGFDGIVIKGKSPKPVYLWLHDGEAELRDAAHLWGKVTGEAEAQIRAEVNEPKAEVLQIGPAGEKLVRFACLINMCTRANGRTGMGAVMGSKNLKAVAVRGHQRPEAADPDKLRELARWGVENVEVRMGAMRKYGTANTVGGNQSAGGLPTRNFTSGSFDEYEKISGPTMLNTILKERDTCFGCAIRCKRVVEIKDGPFQVDPLYGGPEYETLASLGSYCGVSDLAAVSLGNQICNMYGMDTISAGGTVAWAMECYEKGALTKADTGGIDLRFGNAAAMVQMLEWMGKREGFGDLLAEGSARAATEIGKGTEKYLVTCHKQEFPAHMPRVKRTLGLIYAVNPFGADHMSHEHDPNYEESYEGHRNGLSSLGLADPQPPRSLNAEKVRFALTTQWAYSCLDTVNVCDFVWGPTWQLYSMNQLVELIRAATGWSVSLYELIKLGERRLNMLRAYNAREGIDRKDDVPPQRIFEPLEGGLSDSWAMDRAELAQAFDTYYEMAGWDVATGTPGRAKLAELGVEWVADIVGL